MLWCAPTYVLANEDHEERSDQVVYPLNVSTGRVSDSPYKQDPFENLKENGIGSKARNEHSKNLLKIYAINISHCLQY